MTDFLETDRPGDYLGDFESPKDWKNLRESWVFDDLDASYDLRGKGKAAKVYRFSPTELFVDLMPLLDLPDETRSRVEPSTVPPDEKSTSLTILPVERAPFEKRSSWLQKPSQEVDLRLRGAALNRLHRTVWLALLLVATACGLWLGWTLHDSNKSIALAAFCALGTLGLGVTWHRAGSARP